uniref:K Homology domain-containing protein n=1 Tax=Ursus americanus TaxID=9643 RepID=A0A452QMM8_URSAM
MSNSLKLQTHLGVVHEIHLPGPLFATCQRPDRPPHLNTSENTIMNYFYNRESTISASSLHSGKLVGRKGRTVRRIQASLFCSVNSWYRLEVRVNRELTSCC